MSIFNHEEKYLRFLSERKHSVKELSEKLFASEPTVRRYNADVAFFSCREISDD